MKPQLRICTSALARAALAAALACAAGCQQKMADQPSYKPLDASTFFADGRSARPRVAGTVARGHLQIDRALATGRYSGRKGRLPPAPSVNRAALSTDSRQDNPPKPNDETEPSAMPLVEREAIDNSDFVDSFPLEADRQFVEHGRQRYMIYCVVCHDPLGRGHGKIVERGYTAPPTYHSDRLRQAPPGYLFAVMSEGYGSMPSYGEQIPVRDRWAIAAYVRALQLSQHFPADEVPDDVKRMWTAQNDAGQSRQPEHQP